MAQLMMSLYLGIGIAIALFTALYLFGGILLAFLNDMMTGGDRDG